MNNTTNTYLKALTFPRFLLALFVITYHFGLHLPFAQHPWLRDFFNQGAVAVSFFFFLSGFVLSYKYNNQVNFISFYWKRIVRLYPLYVVTFLIVFISVYLLQGKTHEPIYAIANFLGLHAWIPGYALELNFPSWSLSVEFFFYATFPAILWLFQKIKWQLFSLLMLTVWLIGLAQHIYFVEVLYDPERYFLGQFILYFPLFHLTTFLSGFYGGKLIHQLSHKNYSSIIYTLLASFGVVLFFLVLATDNWIKIYAHNGALVPIFLMICVGLALDKTLFPRLIGTKPFIFLGDISYSMYMWQFPVFLWVTYFLEIKEFSQSQFLIFLIILITISALSFKWIEEPIRKRISKKKSAD